MEENKTLLKSCQEENQKNSYFPLQYVENLHLKQDHITPIEQKVLNYLIYKSNKFANLFMRQQVIADCVGKHRGSVNRALKELERKKLIIKEYRHRRACFYAIHPIFKDPGIRKKLSGIFDALKGVAFYLFPLALLLSKNIQADNNIARNINNNIQSSKITHSLRNINKYIKSDSCVRLLILERGCSESKLVHEDSPETLKNKKIEDENPIPGYIRRLSWLALTKWGQIRLSIFPEEVINSIAQKRNVIVDKENPFSYFFKLCKDLCAKRNIPLNWTHARSLEIKYYMPENARMYRAEDIQKPQEKIYSGSNKDLSKKNIVPACRTIWQAPVIVKEDPTVLAETLSTSIEKARSKAPYNSLDLELIRFFVASNGEILKHLPESDIEFLRSNRLISCS